MLPFIAGIATGAIAVIAYRNSDKIKTKVEKGACSVKKLAQEGFEKSKEKVTQLKECLDTCKEETPKDEPKPTATRKKRATKKVETDV